MPLVPVATGSTSGARLLRWLSRIQWAKSVLLAFDADKAGDEAAAWWAANLGSKAVRLRPTEHVVYYGKTQHRQGVIVALSENRSQFWLVRVRGTPP